MDLLYPVSLAVALVAGTVGAAIAALKLCISHEGVQPRGLRSWVASTRVAVAALVLGAVSLVVSTVVHLRWGHGPGSAEPMEMRRFLSEHEAFGVAALILATGFVVAAYETTMFRMWSRS